MKQKAAISGTVIDGATQAAIVGGTSVVALEQNDGTGVVAYPTRRR